MFWKFVATIDGFAGCEAILKQKGHEEGSKAVSKVGCWFLAGQSAWPRQVTSSIDMRPRPPRFATGRSLVQQRASRPFHCPATVLCATRYEGHASGVGAKAHQQSWTPAGAVQCTAVTVFQVVPPPPLPLCSFWDYGGGGAHWLKREADAPKKLTGQWPKLQFFFPTRFDELESVGGG